MAGSGGANRLAIGANIARSVFGCVFYFCCINFAIGQTRGASSWVIKLGSELESEPSRELRG